MGVLESLYSTLQNNNTFEAQHTASSQITYLLNVTFYFFISNINDTNIAQGLVDISSSKIPIHRRCQTGVPNGTLQDAMAYQSS